MIWRTLARFLIFVRYQKHEPMKFKVAFQQGDGSWRFLKYGPTSRYPGGMWYGGPSTAQEFETLAGANDAITECFAGYLSESAGKTDWPFANGSWLGKCSRPFVVDGAGKAV